ncbi:MAG: HAD-IA family hydrolase [Dehalococcoidales bacterium]
MIFDIGGTLLNPADLFEEISFNLTDKPSDKKTGDLVSETFNDLFQNQERYQSVKDVIASTLAFLAKEYRYPDITNRADNIHSSVFLHKSRLFPETLYVLDILRKNNIRMIIASDADTGIVKEQLVKHNLNDYFIDSCTSDLSNAYKPSSAYLSYLTKYTFNNEKNSYFVGDNTQDIESGKRLGIKSVLIDRKSTKRKMDADYVIQDLRELIPILGIRVETQTPRKTPKQ